MYTLRNPQNRPDGLLHTMRDGRPIPKNEIPVSRRSQHEGLLKINRRAPVCKSKSTEQRTAQSWGIQIIFM